MMNPLDIVSRFSIRGEVVECKPFGSGHINKTLKVKTTETVYILQKVNTSVFPNVDGLMNNVVSVTEHLRKKGIETLYFVPASDGKHYFRDGEDCWRIYEFIKDSIAYDTVTDAEIFRLSGEAFGKFQNDLADFNASDLCYTIERFHDTPHRYEDFLTAVSENRSARLDACREEVAFVTARKDTYGKVQGGLDDGTIPLRVTHNDTKLNNILMDSQTGKVRAVIDLDTVMPGSMLYDFGDSIRFGASTAAEDEKDLSKVHFSLEYFKAYTEGYLKSVKDSIQKSELDLLAYSGYLMTMECGMRFLGDFLNGDVYFGTAYPEHNLVRCRTQFRLAKEMEEHMDEMNQIVSDVYQSL